MIFLEKLKLIVEVITSTATAIIVIVHLFEFIFKLSNPIKRFFKITVPMFFQGYTNLDGKKVRFFKGLKQQHERTANIIKAVSPDCERVTHWYQREHKMCMMHFRKAGTVAT
jgi:hypothetical protein